MRMDRQKDITKLTVAFRNFANGSKIYTQRSTNSKPQKAANIKKVFRFKNYSFTDKHLSTKRGLI